MIMDSTLTNLDKGLHFPIRRCIALHACPCGFFGDLVKLGTCSPGIVTKYQKRISGPLLDRIDIHIVVQRVEYEKLNDQSLGEPSAVIQKPVKASCRCQWNAISQGKPNSCGRTM
jgi:magnesium chelatase family protein